MGADKSILLVPCCHGKVRLCQLELEVAIGEYLQQYPRQTIALFDFIADNPPSLISHASKWFDVGRYQASPMDGGVAQDG